jgi:hypothetical protein
MKKGKPCKGIGQDLLIEIIKLKLLLSNID